MNPAEPHPGPIPHRGCAGREIFPLLNAYSMIVDAQGKVLALDSAASRLPAARGLIGRDFLHESSAFPCLSPEVPEVISQGIRETLDGRRDFFCHEYACHSLASRRMRLTAIPLSGVEPARLILTHSDVTERVRQENELQLTQFAMDHAADAVFWVAPDGRFAYVNEAACSLSGYPHERLIRMSVPDLDPEIARKGWSAEWEEIKRAGRHHFDSLLRRQDGQMVPIELTATYVKFKDRELSCAFVRDVSDRKKLEEQFFQAQKLEAIARLAGGVAHDFNNLLTVINGYSNMLLEQASPKDSLRELYQEIYDAGRRAAGLTRQLLAFSRKEVIVPVALDLNTLLRQFEKMIRRLLGEDIQIGLDMDPELGKIKADPGQIEQVVMNLAVNARDAMPQGGSLVVQTVNVTLDPASAQKQGGIAPGPYVRLIVADTGCGMDESVHARLFEPFFTTKERGRGTGLGLSTVYGIVRGCGGHISVESEVGKGSAFTILFPVSQELVPKGGTDFHPGPFRGTETILLLEDDLTVRKVARRILESQGYRILEALTEQEALEKGSDLSQSFDLLLTDIVLPSLSGLEVARRLTEIRPGLRILLMSGYTDHSIHAPGALPEGMGFIQKPFTVQTLVRKVREILDSRLPVEMKP
ncbi:MAG TPA: ATP-binding protein [Planctomycetota bacterium]|nr:ATP-binding protein [Planctomycetota bacterium]